MNKGGKLSSLTIFMPAFNEEKNIKSVIKDAEKHAKKVAKKYEVLIINDGSRDNTAKIVKSISQKNKSIKLISHDKNRGYGAAVKTGMKNASMDWVFFTDSDGQFKFDELEKFVESRHKADLIIGYRKKRMDPFHRIFIAQVLLKIWNRILFGLKVKDVDCAYKLIPRKILEDIELKTESAITVTEFLVKAKKLGYEFHQIPVTHYPREHGVQTGGNLSVITKAAKDSFNLFKEITRKRHILLKLLVLVLLPLSLFLRLYRIQNTLNFHHDEGRDVLIVLRMIKEGRPVLIGPQTSMGNMYLGPLYYYIITPALLLFNFNPVGPAVLIALTGTVTVWYLYKFVSRWFNRKTAFLSAILYAIMPLPVLFTRNSWNPNLAPLISLLALNSLFNFFKETDTKKKRLSIFLVGIYSGILLQLHYVALLFIAWLFLYLIYYYRKDLKKIFRPYLLLFAGLAFILLPFLLFELRHNFVNTQAAITFIESSDQTNFRFPGPFWLYLRNMKRTLLYFTGGLFGREYIVAKSALSPYITAIYTFILIASGMVVKKLKKHKSDIFLALYTLLTFSLLVSGLYQSSIYVHYLGFLIPVAYILISTLAFYSKDFISKLTIMLIIFSLIYSVPSLVTYLIKAKDSNHQVEKTKEVVSYVLKDASGSDYNFVTAQDTTRDATYTYFLYLSDNPPKDTLKDTVYLVCEDRPCTVTDANSPNIFRKGPSHPSLSNYLGHPFYDEFTQEFRILDSGHISYGVFFMKLQLSQ